MVEVHKDEIVEFIDTASYIMENVPKTFIDTKNIPMKVDFKIGMSWGSMTEAELINGKVKIKE